jgi:hypothetical protein
VQLHYDEGVANHIGPEPCVGARERAGEGRSGCTESSMSICGCEIGCLAQNLALTLVYAKPLTNLQITELCGDSGHILRMISGEYLDKLRTRAHNLRKKCGQ